MQFSTFKDILEFAIKREEEAAHTYQEMAGMAELASSRKLLRELQKEEQNHKKLLVKLSKEKIESARVKDVMDLKISDYLLEEPLNAEMDFQALLIFAAKKEQKAFELYSDLADKSEKKEQEKLFRFLAAQEKSHKLKLETEYEKHVLLED